MLENSVMEDCERDVGMVIIGGPKLSGGTRDKLASPVLNLPLTEIGKESALLSSTASPSSVLLGEDTPLMVMQKAVKEEEEEARFRVWYFGKLLYSQAAILVVTFGVYTMCVPEDDAQVGGLKIGGTVVFSLSSGVYILFCVAIAALLAVRQLPERWRGKAVAASSILHWDAS